MSGLLRALPMFMTLLLGSCIEPNWTVDRTISTAAVATGVSPGGYIPPGTIIGLRNEEEIQGGAGSRRKRFRALLVREVIGGNGSVLVLAGVPAEIVIMDFYEGGKTTSGQLQLGLAAITLNGTSHRVHGGEVPYGPLGTLVNASYTGPVLRVKGTELHVPAGTEMDYQTDEPIYLEPAGTEQSPSALRSCLRKATECSAHNAATNFTIGIASARNADAVSARPHETQRRTA